MSLSDDELRAYRIRFEHAESYFRQGDYIRARPRFQELFDERYFAARGKELETVWDSAELAIANRAADSNELCGFHKAAFAQRQIIWAAWQYRGDRFETDRAATKLIPPSLACRKFAIAKEAMCSLEQTLGPITEIDFSAAGLDALDRSTFWPGRSDDEGGHLRTLIYYAVPMALTSCFGEYPAAVAMLSQGLKQARSASHATSAELIPFLELALARANLEQGNLAGTEQLLHGLFLRFRDTTPPQLQTQALETSCALFLMRGQFAHAQAAMDAVYNLCRSLELDDAAALSALNLARVSIYLNQFERAVLLLEEAQNFERVADRQALDAQAFRLRNLALVRSRAADAGTIWFPSVFGSWDSAPIVESDNPQDAQTFPSTTPNTMDIDDSPDEQAESFLDLFNDLVARYETLLRNKRFDEAGQRLDVLRLMYQDSTSDLIEVKLHFLQASQIYFDGDVQACDEWLSEIEPRLARMGLQPDVLKANQLKEWCWKRLRRSEADIHRLAVENQERFDAMIEKLSPDERRWAMRTRWPADECALAGRVFGIEELRSRIDARQASGRPIHTHELDAAIRQVQLSADRFKQSLALRSSAQLDDTEVRNRQLPPQRKTVDAKTALLGFIVLNDRLFVTIEDMEGLRYTVLPVSRAVLREAVAELHRSLGRIMTAYLPPEQRSRANAPPPLAECRKQVRAALERLSDLLKLSSILDRLPGTVDTLLIAPDDGLHGVPFGCLKRGETALIEKYAIALVQDRLPRASSPIVPISKGLLAGESREVLRDWNGKTERFDPLPGVPDELQAVREMWPGQAGHADPTLDADFTRGVLTRELPRAQIAHIACHGDFKPDDTANTGLVLRRGARGDGAEIFSIEDAAQLDLRGLVHLTLASCWAADSYIQPGRWIESLPDAICRAGAGSVLACLWPVAEGVSKIFLTRFYNYLHDPACSRAEALKRAQLDFKYGKLLLSNQSLPGDELFWAGFQLYGDARPVRFA